MRLSAPLGNLTPRAFLRRHWQKSPRLIRRAFPNFKNPITVEQLLALACKTNVESRLVMRARTQPGWRVQHGPISPRQFRALPSNNWTLLIQDCDKYLPSLADFLMHFSFIPNWRIDDLMISYAVDGGSVGPHVDAYDVFLLQAYGRRRWDISRKPQQPLNRLGLDLKLVRAFRPEHSWILEPGDMLYLPPGVAHHGVALDECLTFSIGMRAPSDAELLADFNTMLLTHVNSESRYTDRDLKSAHADPGRISANVLTAIRHRVRAAQHLPNAELDEWFGCFITEPKPWLVPVQPKRKLGLADIRRKLAAGARLERHPAARLAWFPGSQNHTKLFINGHCYTLPPRLAELAKLLCRARVYSAAQLQPWLHDRFGGRLLVNLYNAGLVRFI